MSFKTITPGIDSGDARDFREVLTQPYDGSPGEVRVAPTAAQLFEYERRWGVSYQQYRENTYNANIPPEYR